MSFTTPPAAGAKFRGPVFNAIATELRPITSRLTADTTPKNNDSALAASGMACPVEASKVYRMWLPVLYNGLSAAADLKIGFTYPTGATALIETLGVTTADVFGLTGAGIESATYTFGTSAAADRSALLVGTWIIGANAGTIAVTWAQNTPTAVNSLLRAGSELILTQQE